MKKSTAEKKVKSICQELGIEIEIYSVPGTGNRAETIMISLWFPRPIKGCLGINGTSYKEILTRLYKWIEDIKNSLNMSYETSSNVYIPAAIRNEALEF